MKWLGRRTFVFRIYVSFLVIILLFSVFNLLSVHLFGKSVEKEIIQYNQMMLKNTADRYQTHFERIKTLAFDLYFREEVVAFNHQVNKRKSGEIDYRQAKLILKELRTQVANPMSYLNNLLIHFENGGVILEREGSLAADLMFSRFYVSDRYPLSYWEDSQRWPGTFKIHSVSAFQISGMADSRAAELIPLSFHMPSSGYQIIALLDAEKMKQAFYDSADDKEFMIMDDQGTLLYQTSDRFSAESIPDTKSGPGYTVSDGYYFFQQRDAEHNLTFITAVSSSSIADRVYQTNWNLMVILAVSVVLGLLISLYFVRGIHRPIKQFVQSIMHRSPASLDSRIPEFDLIHQNIRELVLEKENIHRELLNKQSLLTSFGYINKLKAIVSDINEWKDIADLNEPFYLVLFQLHFKPLPSEEAHMRMERIAYYVHEYINVIISDSISSSHTLQIENNQIISVIRDSDGSEELERVLNMLKERLDRDRDYMLVTIGISSVYENSSDFNEAYTEVMELVQHGRPENECQIIQGPQPASPQIALTMQQEQELYAHLQTGSETYCTAFMERMLDQFYRKGATIRQLRAMAEGTLARVVKLMEPIEPLDMEHQRRQSQLVAECTTLEQFKGYFSQLFSLAAAAVRSKKEEVDPIISYVMKHIEKGPANEVSLEQLAEQLNLSAAYLSVYIKEKTGAKFIDHLHGVRIRKAKELLGGSDRSIQDISSQLGYSNVTSFNRMFKKMTGLPPGEYRKQVLIHKGLEHEDLRTLS